MRKVLYMMHKSLREPIPRLHGLEQIRAMAGGRRFAVLSFEPKRTSKEQAADYESVRAWLSDEGVEHTPLRQTGSRFIEIPAGAIAALCYVLFRGVGVLHCRSYIPALMGLLVKRVTRAKLLFDMRGLFVDEYLFVGALRDGSFKLAFARWLERRLLAGSDAIVVVSERFREHLLSRRDLIGVADRERITVIPNRVDVDRYRDAFGAREAARARMGWDDCIVAVYSGSMAPWHMLGTMMKAVALAMEELPELRFLVTVYPDSGVAANLARAAGIPPSRIRFETVRPEEVPGLLVAADLGLLYVRPHVSKDVCAPVKFAEYMAAGLPVAAGGGLGDTVRWITEERLGVVSSNLEAESVSGDLLSLVRSESFRDGSLQSHCRDFAAKKLDMSETVGQYESLYRSLD